MEGPGPKVFLTKALGQEKATKWEDLLNLTKPSPVPPVRLPLPGLAQKPPVGISPPSLFAAAPGGGNTGPRPDPVKTSLGLRARGERSPQAFGLRRAAGTSPMYG